MFSSPYIVYIHVKIKKYISIPLAGPTNLLTGSFAFFPNGIPVAAALAAKIHRPAQTQLVPALSIERVFAAL